MNAEAATPAPFGSNREHLAAELAWLDRCVGWLLRQFHRAEGTESGHGWFLSRKEVEALLEKADPPEPAQSAKSCAELQQARRELDARTKATVEQGVFLPLPYLARRFHLSPVEALALLVCLAGELEGKYSQLYAYLQDDVTHKLPSLDLVLKLAQAAGLAGPAHAAMFSPATPLFFWQLVTVVGDAALPAHRLLQSLVIDQRMLAFVLELRQGDEKLRPILRRLPATQGPGANTHPYQELSEQLQRFLKPASKRLVACFHGPAASEGRRVAQEICREQRLGLLHADLAALVGGAAAGGLSCVEGLRRIYREALLQTAVVYLSGFDALLEDPRAALAMQALEELLREASWITFIEARQPWLMPALGDDLVFLPFALAVPDYAARLQQWKEQRNGDGETLPDRELESVAARYRFSFGEIDETMRLARGRTQVRANGEQAVRMDDVLWACRARSAANFGSLARVTAPRATWDDLVLPEDVLAVLRELCAQVRQRARVLHEWGFEHRLSMGKGLYALFVGPSGTGKTLAAEAIATSLGLGLVKVDLAGVVSKYIGETEKNLQRIFESAERSDAILFFDEADALFGKRSEVKDAHDRYANIEINFLLQRLEEYEGVVILASNLAQNIDESFCRRLHFTVEFPFPNEACRLAIWRNHFPPEAPVDRDVDLPWLAKQFKIPGGSVRNIVLAAAYLAAEGNRPVHMCHLLQAARREFDKMGKPCLSEEFAGPVPARATAGGT